MKKITTLITCLLTQTLLATLIPAPGERLYLSTTNTTLNIYLPTNTTTPSTTLTLPTPTNLPPHLSTPIFINDNALICDGQNAYLINLINPLKPTIQLTLNAGGLLKSPKAAIRTDNTLFIAGDNALAQYELTDPFAPTISHIEYYTTPPHLPLTTRDTELGPIEANGIQGFTFGDYAIQTQFPVYDAILNDDTIYTAEGPRGIGIYTIPTSDEPSYLTRIQALPKGSAIALNSTDDGIIITTDLHEHYILTPKHPIPQLYTPQKKP